MPEMSSQLALALSLKDEATFDNFYVAKNAEIIGLLKQVANGQGEHIIYLCGSRGEGCSHLLQAVCHEAYLQGHTSVYLPLNNLVHLSPEVLNGLESLQIVCIDDLHVIAGKSEWEEAVFHLFNRVHDAGGYLILTARDLPKALHIKLSDLVSRLSWGIVCQLLSLSDEEKLAALRMRAQCRGINLSDEVGKYLLTHCPRHMGTLLAALDALDRASLAAQRRLTIPFVKDVLQI